MVQEHVGIIPHCAAAIYPAHKLAYNGSIFASVAGLVRVGMGKALAWSFYPMGENDVEIRNFLRCIHACAACRLRVSREWECGGAGSTAVHECR